VDLLGHLLRATPHFKGKGQLVDYWLSARSGEDERWRRLPGGAKLPLRLEIPYEAMVWLRLEEEAELVALRRLLRPGDTFVDCGANIGLWTLVAGTAIGGGGQVYAFEPNPAVVGRLRENVARHPGVADVRVIPAAVGRRASRLWLEPGEFHNLAQVTGAQARNRTLVEVVSLDEVLAGERVHGMKLDVEGSELDALIGAEATIRRFEPWICVEFNTLIAKVDRLSDWDVHEYLSELGYRPSLFAHDASSSAGPSLPGHWGPSGLSRYVNLLYLARGHRDHGGETGRR
jgi:FkbM family methyltransferase